MTRFESVGLNSGMDDNQLGHEWLMVPLGGSNIVRLAKGRGFTVPSSSKGSHVEIKEIPEREWPAVIGEFGAFFTDRGDRLFRVTGNHPGPDQITAKNGAHQTTLEVTVHRRTTLTVAFHFLQDQDSQGRVQPRTVFVPADADKWIEGLNDVYGPQANIWFKKAKADWLPIPNLTAVVSPDDAKMLAGKVGSAAPINIFLAGPNIRSTDTTHPNGFYHIPQKIIILKDRIVTDPWSQPSAPMLKTMAHEIGHLLTYKHGAGQGHDFYLKCGYTSDILNTIDGGNIKIPHQRVLDWNPW